ncbi:unannotated protein [freshwater metagenome]|uniref:Unannotated protein n=1 Tax=freshwater metagenome TaxID=449393 RepID=A0A6J6NII0_9ZZZZ
MGEPSSWYQPGEKSVPDGGSNLSWYEPSSSPVIRYVPAEFVQEEPDQIPHGTVSLILNALTQTPVIGLGPTLSTIFPVIIFPEERLTSKPPTSAEVIDVIVAAVTSVLPRKVERKLLSGVEPNRNL